MPITLSHRLHLLYLISCISALVSWSTVCASYFHTFTFHCSMVKQSSRFVRLAKSDLQRTTRSLSALIMKGWKNLVAPTDPTTFRNWHNSILPMYINETISQMWINYNPLTIHKHNFQHSKYLLMCFSAENDDIAACFVFLWQHTEQNTRLT